MLLYVSYKGNFIVKILLIPRVFQTFDTETFEIYEI